MWRFRRRAFTASRANAVIWMRPPPTTAASFPPRSMCSSWAWVRTGTRHRCSRAHLRVSVEGERRDLDAAAADYGRELPAALDVLVLGMGSDGHTASLFPGSPAVLERRRRVILVESPKPPRQRITITPPVIAAARQVVVLVTGRDKAPAVARALDGDAPSPSEGPAVLARDGVWFLDPLAAAQLPRPVR